MYFAAKIKHLNYLSHFFTDKEQNSPELVLGFIFPDLIRMTGGRLRMGKLKRLIAENPELMESDMILKGSMRHFELDGIFHNHPYFHENVDDLTVKLRKTDIIESGKYLNFVGHVLFEILLDAVILKLEENLCDDFYETLSQFDRSKLSKFLTLCQLEEFEAKSNEILNRFISEKFLYRYADNEGIIFALDKVCEKVGIDLDLEDDNKIKLNTLIDDCKATITPTYLSLFTDLRKRGTKL